MQQVAVEKAEALKTESAVEGRHFLGVRKHDTIDTPSKRPKADWRLRNIPLLKSGGFKVSEGFPPLI